MNDTEIILFGVDNTPGIVAVEAGETEVEIFIRQGEHITSTREAFTPWMLTKESGLELSGEGYRHKMTFPTWSEYQEARAGFNRDDILAYASPEKQYLTTTGKTLFLGLSFDDVHRMQVDIETEGLSSEGKILFIAMSDNRGWEEIVAGDEAEMLARFVSIVTERDPDIIEGHNIFGFDLPFLDARAKKCKVPLALGRDGSELSFGAKKNCPVGGYSRPFIPAKIYGRHIIDTLFAVQRFDVAKGNLERYGLKDCAKALGISEPDRVYIPGEEIAAVWEHDPESVKTYALQDVRETRSLAAIVTPPEFYVTQMVPDTFQNAATTGSGEKINSLLVREYLRRGLAIPVEREARSVIGGYTEVRRTGLCRGIVKCDVESLYPSIMISMGVKPAQDTADIFLPALSELTRRRIDAKAKAKSGPDAAYWDGMQSSFKILINSFYGYLGAPFNFNDFDAAERITTTGQGIVKQIADEIEKRGGRVIEIDTDGVYFEVPDGIDTLEAEERLVAEIDSTLPTGIHLAHDGRYAAMLSLKIKNYVLIDYSERKIFRGSSVRSRADESFGREFIAGVVDCLVRGDSAGAGRLYADLAKDIKAGKLPVEKFARRERVTAKTFASTQKKRLAAAAKGAAVGDYITVYERANGEIGLVEEYAGDENREHLLGKLYKFACRLREAFGDDFDTLFPKPGKLSAEAAGQQAFDLF